MLAGFFLLGRGLGAGVILYTSALVVDACTGWGLDASLLVVGLVALAYTTLGGLVADVVSDVLQLEESLLCPKCGAPMLLDIVTAGASARDFTGSFVCPNGCA